MKGLLLYDSVYGVTDKCAKEVAKNLGDFITLEKISDKPRKTVAGFDFVILASPIRFGKITNNAMSQAMILSREIVSIPHAAFFCHIMPKEKLNTGELLPLSFSRNLLAAGFFGGEFSVEKASFIDRIISKLVIKFNPQCKDSSVDFKAIEEFCDKIRQTLSQGENDE